MTKNASVNATGTWIGSGKVSAMTDTHPVTIWRWIKAGRFPAPVYFGSRRRWLLADVEAWIEREIAKPRPELTRGVAARSNVETSPAL